MCVLCMCRKKQLKQLALRWRLVVMPYYDWLLICSSSLMLGEGGKCVGGGL